jgi:hypothetical protein
MANATQRTFGDLRRQPRGLRVAWGVGSRAETAKERYARRRAAGMRE